MEVYLTARMRNDMYEISPVALMTTDGTKVQRVEQWVL